MKKIKNQNINSELEVMKSNEFWDNLFRFYDTSELNTTFTNFKTRFHSNLKTGVSTNMLGFLNIQFEHESEKIYGLHTISISVYFKELEYTDTIYLVYSAFCKSYCIPIRIRNGESLLSNKTKEKIKSAIRNIKHINQHEVAIENWKSDNFSNEVQYLKSKK